jgi:hypothetical protein
LHLDDEDLAVVGRFMADLEDGHEHLYMGVPLQTSTDRWLYQLPMPGLIALIDRFPLEGAHGDWLLDLVSAYHDVELEGRGPWHVP